MNPKDFHKAKEAIQTILSLENDEENKLDVLTALGVQTTSEEVFFACEDIRNEFDSEKIADEVW